MKTAVLLFSLALATASGRASGRLFKALSKAAELSNETPSPAGLAGEAGRCGEVGPWTPPALIFEFISIYIMQPEHSHPLHTLLSATALKTLVPKSPSPPGQCPKYGIQAVLPKKRRCAHDRLRILRRCLSPNMLRIIGLCSAGHLRVSRVK